MNKAIFIGNLFQFTSLREGRRLAVVVVAVPYAFQFPPLREGRLSRMRYFSTLQ